MKWDLSPVRWYKCATYGALKYNHGFNVATFCIKNYDENIIGESERRITDSINFIAKAIAISDGVQFYINRGFIPLIIETNSLTMLNVLEERWKVPWSVIKEV